MMSDCERKNGFTLIEVVIIVAVMAVLAAAIMPSLFQQVIDAKVAATKTSAKTLYEAIAGQADVKGSYGFLGDMGRFPSSVDELAKPPGGAPMFPGTGTFRSVGMGWNGPYATSGTSQESFGLDAWGHQFRITQGGQVRSAGADGAYDTTDDIVYPPEAPKIASRVMVTVKRQDTEGAGAAIDPTGYEVRLYYSNNGTEAFLSSSAAPFAFDNIYPGLHAIAVMRSSSGQIVAQDTVEVPHNTTKLVELFFRP